MSVDRDLIAEAFSLNSSESTPPSVVLAGMTTPQELPAVEDVFQTLDLFFDSKCEALSIEPVTVPGALWEIQIKTSSTTLRDSTSPAQGESTFIVWFTKDALPVSEESISVDLSSLQKNAAKTCGAYLGIASMISERPVEDMRRLYRVLFQVEPDPKVFYDLNSCKLVSPRLARRMVFSASDLSDELLYSTFSEKELFFTRGLRRFGYPELVIDRETEWSADCSGIVARAFHSLLTLGIPEKEGQVLYLGKGVSLLLQEKADDSNAAFLCSVRKEDGLPVSAVVHHKEFLSVENFPVDEDDARRRRLTAIEYYSDCREFLQKVKKLKLPSQTVTILTGLADEGPATSARKFAWYQVKSFTDSGFFGHPLRSGADTDTVDRGKVCYFDRSFILDWRIHSGGKSYSPTEAVMVL